MSLYINLSLLFIAASCSMFETHADYEIEILR